ncbi:MAG: hypothetical protein F7C09_04800 [Aeropyrum sp.]|nr:hypothetical protein [Aeropyrum sp.]
MGYLEAEAAVVHGRIVEGFRAPYREDLSFKTVIVPGFSDGHAHPQVVDAGLIPGRRWRDSYEWLEGRMLRIDERAVRSDEELASRLAAATFARSLLEGVTLVAVTGRLGANVRGWLSLPARPRAVFLPTVMDRAGWPSIGEVEREIGRLVGVLGDGLAKIGVFAHSLATTRPESVRRALKAAASLRGVLGMHMSEGLPELPRLLEVLGRGPYPTRIVAVHCTEIERLPPGVHCISCPASNMILYGRTRPTLAGVEGFGSDWPLLIGSTPRHLPLISGLYPGRVSEILRKATIGGYRAYLVRHEGDFVAYDEDLEEVLSGRALPVWVSIAGVPAVVEGELRGSGLAYVDVVKMAEEAVREAFDKYGDGAKPYIPSLEDLTAAGGGRASIAGARGAFWG